MKQLDQIIEKSLIKNNVLTKKDLERHQQEAKVKGEELKKYLIAENIVTEKQILIAVSQQLGLERVDFNTLAVAPELIEKIPVKIVWYYKIMPVRLEDNTLVVASSVPLDVKTQDELRIHLGMGIKVALSKEGQPVSGLQTRETIEDIELRSEDPTVSHLVNEIIFEAYKKRATDIHIEPYRDRVRFRYRIDGVLGD